MDCCENQFCKSLPDELRAELCANCMKFTYAANTKLPVDIERPFVVVEGIVVATVDDRPHALLPPGTMLLTPYFKPENSIPLVLSEEEQADLLNKTRYECFSPVTVGVFSNETIDRLMDDNRFLRLLLGNRSAQNYVQSNYQIFLHHYDAYESVRHILKIARACHIDKLTHAQIAFLADKNRTTVTKAMHEIALAEPELLEGMA